jgi:VWFA-related protein
VRRPAAIALGVTTAAVAAGLTLAAQDQAPQPTFHTEANYVRVDVYPTRDGAPVSDLTAADFEVVEDKVPQRVEQFERVVIRAAGIEQGLREPGTVAESRQAVQNPRARVFVLFLDPKHVDLAASRQIGQPMVNALNRLMGPDDYFGVMTPNMSARDITFARRATAIEHLLARDWWGERDRLISDDPVEHAYAYCYPGVPGPGQTTASDQGIAQEMILRRREQQTLDALEEMVVYLRGVREERKAVLALTNGWLLYRPNQNLTRPIDNGEPPLPVIGTDPRSGRLTTKDIQNPANASRQTCERDRIALAQIDDEQRLRVIIDEANRSNTSFYPIDPRGLAVFDEGIVPAAGVGFGPNANPTLTPQQDSARLTARVTSLRRLAEDTDGTAVVATNNIEAALRRISDDLSSYYLLGYYSTGKLDGKFHAISVRVKRPGITIRARRGYLSLSAADLSRAAPPPPSSAAASAEMAIGAAALSAVARLSAAVRDLPLRVQVAAGWRPTADGHVVAAFWTVGEVADRIPGGDLEAVLTTASGEIVASARGRIVAGTTSAMVAVIPGQNIQPGDYVVRLRSQSSTGAETVSTPVTLPPESQWSGAIFIRRGPLTGNREVPTADLRFRRSERVRVEVPSAVDATSARLLDRTGRPLAVPVVSATRADADGTRWATAELVLAPLAPGDYVIDVGTAGRRAMAAFRVVP